MERAVDGAQAAVVTSFGVITVCRNDRERLERTWRSLARQSQRVRWHVVDGGSADGTLEWLLELRSSERQVSFTSGPDDGPYDAMNRGWRALESPYLLFLNAGDELFDATTVTGLDRVLSRNAAPLVFGDVELVDRAGNPSPGRPIERDLEALVRFNAIFHQGALIERRLLVELEGYDLRYRFCADYDFFLRCRTLGIAAQFLGYPIARFVRDGLTNRRALAFDYYREMVRVQRAHGLPGNLSLYAIGALKALLGESWSDRLRGLASRALSSRPDRQRGG